MYQNSEMFPAKEQNHFVIIEWNQFGQWNAIVIFTHNPRKEYGIKRKGNFE